MKFVSFFLLILGIIFLFKNLGFIEAEFWGIVWPVLIIAIAASMLFKRKKEPFWYEWYKYGKRIHEEEKEERDED